MNRFTFPDLSNFRFAILAAAIPLVLLTACGESGSDSSANGEDASDSAELTGSFKQAQDQAADLSKRVAQRTQEAVDGFSSDVRNAVEKAEEEGTELAEETRQKLVKQAEEIYGQAKSFLENNRAQLAEQAIEQLQSMKSQLPQTWQDKIDSLQQQFDQMTGSGSDEG